MSYPAWAEGLVNMDSDQSLCNQTAILFRWADNRRIVQQCVTGSPNNTPLVLNSVFPSPRLVVLPRLGNAVCPSILPITRNLTHRKICNDKDLECWKINILMKNKTTILNISSFTKRLMIQVI